MKEIAFVRAKFHLQFSALKPCCTIAILFPAIIFLFYVFNANVYLNDRIIVHRLRSDLLFFSLLMLDCLLRSLYICKYLDGYFLANNTLSVQFINHTPNAVYYF